MSAGPAANSAGYQLFVRIGFAHGFLTLEPDCEVSRKCSDTYAKVDGGITWDSVEIRRLALADFIGWHSFDT